jgi:hypothetical protein
MACLFPTTSVAYCIVLALHNANEVNIKTRHREKGPHSLLRIYFASSTLVAGLRRSTLHTYVLSFHSIHILPVATYLQYTFNFVPLIA